MACGVAAAAGAGRRREVVGGCRARHKDAMRHRGVYAKLLEATARSGARPPDQIELGRAERAGARARWSSALPKRDGARRAGDRTRRSGHVRGLAEARPRRIRRRPLRVCTHLAGTNSGASEAKFAGTCISSFTCTCSKTHNAAQWNPQAAATVRLEAACGRPRSALDGDADMLEHLILRCKCQRRAQHVKAGQAGGGAPGRRLPTRWAAGGMHRAATLVRPLRV